jgi:hypothetical protein
MKTISRRIHILEVSSGLVETAGSRSAREQDEILLRRIAEGRARWAAASVRLGLSPDVSDVDREDLSGLTIVEILNSGRQRALQRNLASQQTVPGTEAIRAGEYGHN